MKKKSIIIGLAVIAVLGGAGAAVAAESTGTYIGKQKAMAAALKAVPGQVTEVDLDREHGTAIYEIEVRKTDGTGKDVDIDVNALTGKVVSIIEDDDDDNRKQTSSNPTDTATSSGKEITAEQAKKLAVAQVKGDVISTKSEWDDGIKQFDVKIRTSDGIAEVELAASNGKLISIDYDNDFNDDDLDDDDQYDDQDDRD